MARNSTGRLAYLKSQETVEIREYEIPSPEPNALVTEVIQANVCGSELHIWKGDHPILDQMVLGHEALCRVTDLGENVETDYAGTPIKEGDIVAPTYFVACGKCRFCGAGEYRSCENALQHWLKHPDEYPHFHGTFATHYYIHPEQHFYKVPETLPGGVAAAANCALTQVLFGLDEADLSHGETVVIQGGGGLGQNAIAVANEYGAETILVEGVDDRIERARDFGVNHVIDFREYETIEERADRIAEFTDGFGADLAVEVAGVPQAFAEGAHLLRDGGRYLEMGNITPGHTTEFDPAMLTRKNIQVVSTMRYDPWYLGKGLEFLEETVDTYPYEQLIDSEFHLSDVQTALEKSDAREVTRASLITGH